MWKHNKKCSGVDLHCKQKRAVWLSDRDFTAYMSCWAHGRRACFLSSQSWAAKKLSMIKLWSLIDLPAALGFYGHQGSSLLTRRSERCPRGSLTACMTLQIMYTSCKGNLVCLLDWIEAFWHIQRDNDVMMLRLPPTDQDSGYATR